MWCVDDWDACDMIVEPTWIYLSFDLVDAMHLPPPPDTTAEWVYACERRG